MKGVHIFIQAVGGNTLGRAAQSLSERLDEKVVLSQTHEHDPIPGGHAGHCAAFHHLASVPRQSPREALQNGHRGIERRVAASTGKDKINTLRKCLL